MKFLVKRIILIFALFLWTVVQAQGQFDEPAQAAYFEALDLIRLKGNTTQGIKKLNQTTVTRTFTVSEPRSGSAPISPQNSRSLDPRD